MNVVPLIIKMIKAYFPLNESFPPLKYVYRSLYLASLMPDTMNQISQYKTIVVKSQIENTCLDSQQKECISS